MIYIFYSNGNGAELCIGIINKLRTKVRYALILIISYYKSHNIIIK